VRVFITGITGPVGSALADYLVTLPGVEVHAFKRWRSDTRPIAHLLGRITVHEGDIEDPYSVARAVERAAPERVYHLAAQSYPSESWDAPVVTMRTNVEGTINLLEAVRRYAPRARVHIAGTSAEYGWVRPEETPIRETHPTRPLSPYGVSKVAAGIERLAVRCQLRFTRCRHPFIQSRWSAPGRPVRHSDILPSDGADRA
jgi:GDP-4-dehydro-6-deoxy-D-mannose reductase